MLYVFIYSFKKTKSLNFFKTAKGLFHTRQLFRLSTPICQMFCFGIAFALE